MRRTKQDKKISTILFSAFFTTQKALYCSCELVSKGQLYSGNRKHNRNIFFLSESDSWYASR